ncbi:MAG TPA: hypothetical protein VF519_02995 [Mycobacteriales bacterium]|jgi:hypothetical protein
MRRTLLPLLAVALLPAGTGALAARDAGGATVALTVKLTKQSIDVRHAANAFGASHVVRYHVKGTVSGPGYTTSIDDTWTETGGAVAMTSPPLRRYPVLPESTVVLEYGAAIVTGGAATGVCHGTITRIAGGATLSTGGC